MMRWCKNFLNRGRMTISLEKMGGRVTMSDIKRDGRWSDNVLGKSKRCSNYVLDGSRVITSPASLLVF